MLSQLAVKKKKKEKICNSRRNYIQNARKRKKRNFEGNFMKKIFRWKEISSCIHHTHYAPRMQTCIKIKILRLDGCFSATYVSSFEKNLLNFSRLTMTENNSKQRLLRRCNFFFFFDEFSTLKINLK